MNNNNNNGNIIMNCLGIVILVAIIPTITWIISLWTDSNLEFWLSYLKGEVVDVPMWISIVVTLVLNGVIVVGNILTELFKLVI